MAPVRRGAPGFVIANDGLPCAGSLVQLGDTQERVAQLCGPPIRVGHWMIAKRSKTSTLDVWRYERYGSLPRLLQFESGVRLSIAATSTKQ